MSHSLIAPEYELFPDRYRWSVAECRRMAEEGHLVGRYEILDGEVVSKMGQKPAHFFSIALLTHWANNTFGDPFVRVQGPIALPGPDGDYSEPEPDLSITREPMTAYQDHHPGPGDLLMVIEVSDTSLRLDLIVKARLYARAGIPEYWALDLNARQLHLHREPNNGEYAVVIVCTAGEHVAPATLPDGLVAVAALLPSASS